MRQARQVYNYRFSRQAENEPRLRGNENRRQSPALAPVDLEEGLWVDVHLILLYFSLSKMAGLIFYNEAPRTYEAMRTGASRLLKLNLRYCK